MKKNSFLSFRKKIVAVRNRHNKRGFYVIYNLDNIYEKTNFVR